MPITKSFAGLSGFGFGILPFADMDSIATVTVGSGGASTIEFTNIPQNYQHLQICGLFRESRALTSTGGMDIRLNNDTGTNYTYHRLYGTGSSLVSSGGTGQTAGVMGNIPRNNETTSAFATTVINILDYASTSKNKTLYCFNGYNGNNTAGYIGMDSSLWISTSAVTSILVRPPGGNGNFIQYVTASLYGLRAS